MKPVLSLIRRHPRLSGGLATIFLAAFVIFAVRAAGPAHAAAGPAHAATGAAHATAPSTVAASPALSSSARSGRVAFASATSSATARSSASRPSAGPAGSTARPGSPAATPSTTALARALRQATGLSPAQVTAQSACPAAATGQARCAAEVLIQRSNHALVHPRLGAHASVGQAKPAGAGSSPEPQLFTPQYLEQGYDLSYLSQTGGQGDTVALVDAGDDPNAASDLATYRQTVGLPACNGCFEKVNQTGGTSSYPSDQGWDVEESLDIDAVSAICPNCHILLVEANSDSLSDLDAAMRTAHKLGANQISDSWTATMADPPGGSYTFSGVATVAATGDDGYVGAGEDNYPAALPGVTAAGGTTLSPAGAPNARGFAEAAWSGGGSGCDLNEAKPGYQTDSGCTGRSYADVSADADPDTGLEIYDSSDGGWELVGGTSLATPTIAAYYALTGVDTSSSQAGSPQWAYTDSGLLNDITSGSNGTCATDISYICDAGVGYDGPTGVGSISGDVVAGAPGIGGPAIPAGSANTYTQSATTGGATITGGIYPNGLDTTWWIDYWPASGSSGNAQQTTPTDIGSGTGPVTVTGGPTGLQSKTTYDYELMAENSDGTTTGYVSSFTTSPGVPTAAFTPTPTPATPNSPVSFNAGASTAGGTASITDYRWNFGDGTTVDAGTTAAASHTYTSPGTYTVTLTVANSDGQSESASQTVTVDAPPTAAFSVSPSQPAPGSQISFDATGSSDSVGTITGYSWNIAGPGSGGVTNSVISATGARPTENGFERGSYQVTLTVTNDAGQSNTSAQTVTVDDPPTASTVSFTPSATVITPGSNVNFTDTATSPDADLGGSIAGYNWNFGDGTTGSGPDPSHTYSSPGTYPVSLTVTDDLGESYTTPTQTITVDAPPTASFTTPSTSPGAPVAFDASGSSDSVGTIQSYDWSITAADGTETTATGENPTEPLARGTYTVTLTVTNDALQSGSATQTVTVDDPPTASVTPSATVTTPGATVTFGTSSASPDASTGGSITGYSWNFGDGTTSDVADPSHTYASPGTYDVSLTVTDNLGMTHTASTTITVDAVPAAAFTASSDPVTAGSAVGFNAGGSSDSVGTITGYSWNFGDGATATGADPSHTYTSPGTYAVSLTVTNDAGQSATRTGSITVSSPPSPTSPVTSTPVPAPTPAPAPKLTPVATPKSLSAGLGGAKKQKLAPALAHGLRVSLALNQGTKATFQVTLPVSQSRLARGRKGKNASITLLQTRAQTLGAGNHVITLKLSRAASRELALEGPLVLTVKVTLTAAGGATTSRTLKITLVR